MSAIITIPVTPLVLSIYNECKLNLKHEDKSNTDFLIFLLNSATHIYTIVKEFSPVLQDGLEQIKSNLPSTQLLSSPRSTLSNSLTQCQTNGITGSPQQPDITTTTPTRSGTPPHEEDTNIVPGNSHLPSRAEEDDTFVETVESLEKELSSLIADVTLSEGDIEPFNNNITDHFNSYIKSVTGGTMNTQLSPGNKARYVCDHCQSSFSFKHGLNRHMKNNSCSAKLGKSLVSCCPHCFKKVDQDNFKIHLQRDCDKFNTSMCQATCKENNMSDTINNNNNNNNLILVELPKCTVCFKSFSNTSNLRKHLRRTLCGRHPLAQDLADTISTTDLMPLIDDDTTPDEPVLSKSLPLPDLDGAFPCSYCGSVLSSRRGLANHKYKFRCKRKCKLCGYVGTRTAFIQQHLRKDHNLEMTLEEIEDYNRDEFKKFMAERGEGVTLIDRLVGESDSPDTNHEPLNDDDMETASFQSVFQPEVSDSAETLLLDTTDFTKLEGRCPVYECLFSSPHRSGLHTHVKYHISRVQTGSNNIHCCKECNTIGIPLDKVAQHDANCFPRESNENLDTAQFQSKRKCDVSVSSAGVRVYPCKHCSFVGTSSQSLGGHMNLHYKHKVLQVTK